VIRAAAVAALALALLATPAGATEKRPYGWQCDHITNALVQWNCYVRFLLTDIDRSGDPADELPRIDRRARQSGTSLAGMCHALMHEVGRRWGAEHHVTLGGLMRFIPRSNDPTCSAGFGMGLVMYLGPQIILSGGRTALAQCERAPTRYRSYTCIHGIGHALMRAYHGDLRHAVQSCRRLGEQAPDCAEGAFHDYWISLHGADGTTLRAHGLSPRFLCNGHLWYVRPCWYRYFVEDATGPIVDSAHAIRAACRGLHNLQRYACVGGAAHAIPQNPLEQTRICARLDAFDSRACVRGVAVEALERTPRRQHALFALCARLPDRADCERWFGRTLAVVTNGRFRCPDRVCREGAALIARPLVTFS
jgi:hypothetical protein